MTHQNQQPSAVECPPPEALAEHPDKPMAAQHNDELANVFGGSPSKPWSDWMISSATMTLQQYSYPDGTPIDRLPIVMEGLYGIRPTDVTEGMLAAQMLACHHASMECFRRAAIPGQTFQGRNEALSQAGKLSRTYATLVEALNRHRGKGQQKVTVEHVHVHPGGQAIVGSVTHPGGGPGRKSKE